MKGIITEKYFGTIVGIPDTSESYKANVQIPGVGEVLCYPDDRNADEPNIGDMCIVEDFDPIHHTYFTYKRISEDVTEEGEESTEGKGTFQGMRSRGKSLEFNDNYLQLGTYQDGDFDSNKDTPSLDSFIKLTSEGELTIQATKNADIRVEENGFIVIKGKAIIHVGADGLTMEIDGPMNLTCHDDLNLSVDGTFNINASETSFSGGILTINDIMGVPFNTQQGCPYCPGKHGSDTVLLKASTSVKAETVEEALGNLDVPLDNPT